MAKRTRSPGILPHLKPARPKKPSTRAAVRGASAAWGKPQISASMAAGVPKPPPPLSPGLQEAFNQASTPASPGVAPTRVDPFLTGEQQMQDAQYWGNIAEQAAAARQRLLQQQTVSNANIEDAKKQEAQSLRSQNWQAAARGIFRSSIRDNALNDITATTTTQVNRLMDAVDAVRNENLAAYGYTFDGAQGAADVQNAGMVKDASGNWVPNTASRTGKAISGYLTGQQQLKADNAKAMSDPGTPAVAASGPDRQWFISQLTQQLSAPDRQNLRDRAVKAGFAKYKNGSGGAIVWL